MDIIKHTHRIKQFLSKKSTKIAGIIILAILVISWICWGIFRKTNVDFVDNNGDHNTPTIFTSKLTGLTVTDKNLVDRATACVMIENSPEARPQSGLKDAGVVFEAIAEGGITRFMAIYQEQNPELLGPVRSLRPYYLEWAGGFDCGLAHVGGSDEALSMIRSGKYSLDLDQFFNADTYWRSSDRYAPHNVYTNATNLWNLLSSKNKTASNYAGFARGDDKSEITATTIDIPISSYLFNVHYDYDQTANVYLRKEGGEKHNDRELGQIAPNVVIVIKTEYGLMADGKHSSYRTTGTGTAYIFQNGTIINGTWNKDSVTSQIKFLNENNEEIKLNPGQTWITATDEEISYQ